MTKFKHLQKSILILLVAFVGIQMSANAQTDRPIPSDTVRILAIGNSFSQDAIEQYFYNLAEADNIHVIVGNLYYGGCSLQQHYEFLTDNKPVYQYRKIVKGIKVDTPHMTMDKVLGDEPWDYISFRQASHYSGQQETYTPYLHDLMTYVREHAGKETKYIFHMTWAYSADSDHGGFKNYNNSQMEMYNAIVKAAQNALGIEKFDILVPCGTAIQNARTSDIGDNLCRDGYHLQLVYGRYTAACTWFEAVFGKSVIGNKYAPIGISEYQKSIAQRAAHNAVAVPFNITETK